MSKFSGSIGGSNGSSSVNGTSVNLSQSKNFVVCGKPGGAMKEAGAGRTGAKPSAPAGSKPAARPTGPTALPKSPVRPTKK